MTSVQSGLHQEPAGLGSNRDPIGPRGSREGAPPTERRAPSERGPPSREEQRGGLQRLFASGWVLGGRAALVAGGGVAGVRGHAVLGEHRLELLQRGVRAHPGGVEVRPAHPEARLRQVLEELVQPAGTREQRWSVDSL